MDISELVKSVTLEESIETIAYTAKIELVVPDWMSEERGLEKGMTVEILKEDGTIVFYGILWDKATDQVQGKKGTITVKERTVYMEQSEDQVLFKEGTTATERNRELAEKWTIPLGDWDDTEVALAKGKPEVNTIYRLMMQNIYETYEKGGRMYRMRMTEKGLELKALADNQEIYDITEELTHLQQTDSLEGAVTQVKVIGKKTDDKKSEVLAEHQKEVEKYGTIQKIITDDKVNEESTAEQEAQNTFGTGKGGLSAEVIDIPELRAGHTVYIRGHEYYIAAITHTLGEPGTMKLTLETEAQIAQRYKTK